MKNKGNEEKMLLGHRQADKNFMAEWRANE